MTILNFSLYVKRRNAARAVAETVSRIDRPGSVIELKQKVSTWLDLHREVVRKQA